MTLGSLSDATLSVRHAATRFLTRNGQLTRQGECQLTPDNLRDRGSGVHRGDPASGFGVKGPGFTG